MALPKNLVYVFVIIIFMAFLGMAYLIYSVSSEDLSNFTSYDREKEVITIDPVLRSMLEYMHLDEYNIPEMAMSEFSEHKFFDDYLSQ